jgi:hypothetical protein
MFQRVRKKYGLLSVFFVMAPFGGRLMLVKGSAVAPFIYPVF